MQLVFLANGLHICIIKCAVNNECIAITKGFKLTHYFNIC